MKTILKLTLACVFSLSFMTLVSCGSKVNQKELNEKIEKASENTTFTDAEYDFMAKYLLDRIAENKEVQPDDPEAETIGNYMMILAEAQYHNNLKGDAKKDFEDIQKKLRSMDNSYSMTPDSSYDDSVEVVEEVGVEWDSDTLRY